MPNIKQQQKRVRVAARQRLENLRYRSTIKTLTRRLEVAVEEGDDATVDAERRRLEHWLDLAATRGAIHKNKAARRKSQVARLASGTHLRRRARPSAAAAATPSESRCAPLRGASYATSVRCSSRSPDSRLPPLSAWSSAAISIVACWSSATEKLGLGEGLLRDERMHLQARRRLARPDALRGKRLAAAERGRHGLRAARRARGARRAADDRSVRAAPPRRRAQSQGRGDPKRRSTQRSTFRRPATSSRTCRASIVSPAAQTASFSISSASSSGSSPTSSITRSTRPARPSHQAAQELLGDPARARLGRDVVDEHFAVLRDRLAER